jgi:Methylamine utilisation protein MauE
MSSAALSTLASGVLALLFGWAGLAKVLRAERWRQDLMRYRLPRSVRVSAFLLLPWVELSVVMALIAGAPVLGAAVALGLMLAFSVVILRARLLQQGNKLGCGCFGNSAVLDYRVMLLRNAAMAALLVFVLAVHADGRQILASPPIGLLVALLGLVLVAAASWIGWQIGVHLQRRRQPQP